MQGKSKRRVRLEDPPDRRRDMTKANAARDEAFRTAPRDSEGRMIPGFRYKQLVDAYEAAGLEPTVIDENHYNLTKPPLFLSRPDKGRKILKMLRKGMPYTTVCRFIGINRKTFIDWMVKGQEGHPHYVDFYEKICKAEAQAEIKRLEQLRLDGRGDWKSSAWQLERRWPEHWARRDAFKAEVQANVEVHVHGKEKLAKQVVDDEASRELARRMIDGQEYGYEDLSTKVPAE